MQKIWNRTPFIITLLLVGVLLTYSSALQGGFVANDDAMLITNNPLILEGGWAAVMQMFLSYDPELYIPLTLISFKAEYLLFGLNPLPFHAVNILLHSLNAVLVFFLIRGWSGKKGVAVLTALLFAVHPIQVEAVSWIASRKDLLSAAFFLGALLSYEKGQKKRWTLLLYLLSLLAKGNAISFPIVLLLLEYRKGKRFSMQMIRTLMPYFALALLFIFIGFMGKVGRIADMPLVLMPLFAAKAILLQIYNTLWPFYLTPIYATANSKVISLAAWIAIGASGLGIAAVYALRKKFPSIFFGFFFFLITLAPSFFVSMNIIGYYKITSDRYAYISIIGLLYILSIGFAVLWRRARTPAVLVLCGIIPTLAYTSHRQTTYWETDTTVLEMMIRRTPEYGMSYLSFGNYRLENGETEEAIALFEEGISRESYPFILGMMHNSLGKAYEKMGRTEEARNEWNKALLLVPEFEEPREQLESLER